MRHVRFSAALDRILVVKSVSGCSRAPLPKPQSMSQLFPVDVPPAEERDVLWRAHTTKREKQPGPKRNLSGTHYLSIITNVAAYVCIAYAGRYLPAVTQFMRAGCVQSCHSCSGRLSIAASRWWLVINC